METTKLASGIVSSFDNEYALAGVNIHAYLPEGFPGLPGASLSEPLEIASAASAADGSFSLHIDETVDNGMLACFLGHCATTGVQLRCYDLDGSLLAEIETASFDNRQNLELALLQPDWTPGTWEWQQVGQLMERYQVETLDVLTRELTTLSPIGMFRGWTVQQRLGLLEGLESALLDPDGLLAARCCKLRLSQLHQAETRAQLREEVVVQESPELLNAFDHAVLRSNLISGHMGAAEVLLDHMAFEQGDLKVGVNRFLKPGMLEQNGHHDFAYLNFFDRFPWMRNPLASYRDYLVDIWVQRATRQLDGQVLTANGAIQQLANRFHQDFTIKQSADQPANRLVNDIMLRILTAPTENDFGFGIAPAGIAPQNGMSDREYLDYLISLTGEERHELEKRYRIPLDRSDLETSNPVQQNIETLQRFFTDSFQSVQDPYAILPPLTGNGLPIINDYTYPNQGHSPFFWQFEEWLERNEPFYAENYFDIRRTFRIFPPNEEIKKKHWGTTISLGQFIGLRLDTNDLFRFTPPKDGSPATYAQRVDIGNQWARNLTELQDLINDAHKDFYAGFYPEAERKYVELNRIVDELKIRAGRWSGTSWDKYKPGTYAARQGAFIIKDPKTLDDFENLYHVYVGYSFSGENWVMLDSKDNSTLGHVSYLLEMLLSRLLPVCLAETRLAMGKYREAIQGGTKPYDYNYSGYPRMEISLAKAAQFGVLTGPTPVEPGAKATPPEETWWVPQYKPNTGSLAFATDTATSTQDHVMKSDLLFPANAVEKAYFRLKLGDAMLEWADVLYRTNRPQNINRARELYKGVLYLHGEDPDISPKWDEWQWWKQMPLGIFQLKQNPALTAQINRAQIGFEQINAGLNYYGYQKDYVPPVRYRVLREAAERFAASAKSTQTDYLSYMQKYEQSVLDEMTARSLVEKASYAIQIAEEHTQIARFHVGEAKKQVEAVKAQIEVKKKEIADADGFFSQAKDFFGGMKDSMEGLGKSFMAGMKDEEGGVGAGNGNLDVGALYKVISSKGGTSATAAGLTGGMAVMAGYGAFVYAGYTSMSSMAEAAARRSGELKTLQEVALPAAHKMVELKEREVKIAGLQKSIAQADYTLGQKMLAFYDYRFLSKAFWQQLSGFANRLMRRYLDIGGRTAWFAERALSFETDKDIRVVSFDYFPKHLRGVTGADILQLHLAELEATRIFGLSQTIPVKQTFSMARDFPIAFGQLKKNGHCHFNTSETPLQLAYPGVYGYRLRNLSIGATYTDEVMPHKGMLTNNGFSRVSRQDASMHRLLRYPDALPLSEFNLRDDMLVYDLPDETLLPFEGSGIDTTWQLSLSRLGQNQSLERLTDILLTFDMRARYSAALQTIQQTQIHVFQHRSLLISGKAQNPGKVAKFKADGGLLTLTFQPALAAGNTVEKTRTVTFLALVAGGVKASPLVATLEAGTDGLTANLDLEDGIALSNSGFLAAANGGIPLPLNDLTGTSANQPFIFTLDEADNAGVDFSELYDVQLFVEYKAGL